MSEIFLTRPAEISSCDAHAPKRGCKTAGTAVEHIGGTEEGDGIRQCAIEKRPLPSESGANADDGLLSTRFPKGS